MNCLELGIVRWFNNRSGEGYIKDRKGRSIYAHHTAIDIVIDVGPELITGVLFPGQAVSMRVHSCSFYTRVEYVGSVEELKTTKNAPLTPTRQLPNHRELLSAH